MQNEFNIKKKQENVELQKHPENSIDISSMKISDSGDNANIFLKKRSVELYSSSPVQTSKFNVGASPFVSSSNQQQINSTPIRTTNLNQNINKIRIPIFNAQSIPHHITYSSPLLPCDSRILKNLPSRQLAYSQTSHQYDDKNFRIPSMPPPFPALKYSNRQDNCYNMDSNRSFETLVLPNGTIQIKLRDGIRIDMTLDKAVRVINQYSQVAISISSNGNLTALIHPNGRIYQYDTRVEILAYDGMKTNNYVRYAKMWSKGVSFTSEKCALTFLVDTAGTRTINDTFMDMSKDCTITVYYHGSNHGPSYVQEANNMLKKSKFECAEDGTETLEINDFRISQTNDGLVKLTRNQNRCLIRTSPGNGSATLTTPMIHCTASLGKTSHLFVRRGERRMHFDGSSFVVRNAGHSAGFDENNLLNVY